MMRQVEKNEVYSHVPEYTDIIIPTLSFLPCFITFCRTHSYTSYFYEIFATCSCTFFITIVYFFYADYGILYEELLVREKTLCVCCILILMIYICADTHTYIHVRIRIRTIILYIIRVFMDADHYQ